MPINTNGINHPAMVGRNYDETVAFYTGVLGMRLVLEQPNLDDPGSTHLFFEAGPGQFIAYFVPRQGSLPETPQRRQLGGMLHLALNLSVPIEEAMEALDAAGVSYKGPIDRGYERSLYFRDPNGAVIELLTWITPLPPGVDEGDVIVAAQTRRRARRADFIEDEDVRAALAEMARSGSFS
jgi:catechol 2,3-dioxygenase-like lactoylglutathione lyase family enzyme